MAGECRHESETAAQAYEFWRGFESECGVRDYALSPEQVEAISVLIWPGEHASVSELGRMFGQLVQTIRTGG